MPTRGIRLFGDPVLRAKSQRVDATAPSTQALVNDLSDTLTRAQGIGLAANQIGVESRVCIVDLSKTEVGGARVVMLNPEVISTGEPVRGEEGCLSFPGLYVQVDRPETAHIRYETPEGCAEEIEAKGLLARVLLHEIDHLDGKLFIDGLSSARRIFIAARLKKTAKRQKRGETV